MTVLSDLNRLLGRELATLRDELLAYPDDASVWALPAGVPNSAGTLTLHLAGNLRFYIGAQLGATGYVRDRDAEFAQRNVPRETLIQLIERAADEVTRTFAALDPATLPATYPVEVGGLRLDTQRFLMHLEAHFAYHLGQIDYHRRIVTGHSRSVGALPLPALADH
ncbi:MAG: DUF1572 family protein [Gemmatimonadetes bacterium]|nr:DUF1572 family protein [Gemmatimonadota bacterium]